MAKTGWGVQVSSTSGGSSGRGGVEQARSGYLGGFLQATYRITEITSSDSSQTSRNKTAEIKAVAPVKRTTITCVLHTELFSLDPVLS